MVMVMVMVVPLLLSPISESMSCFLEAILAPSMDHRFIALHVAPLFSGIKILCDLSHSSLDSIFFSSIHPSQPVRWWWFPCYFHRLGRIDDLIS